MLRDNDADLICQKQQEFLTKPNQKTLAEINRAIETIMPSGGGDAVMLGDLLATQHTFANNPSAENFRRVEAHMLVWQHQRTK